MSTLNSMNNSQQGQSRLASASNAAVTLSQAKLVQAAVHLLEAVDRAAQA